MHQDSSFSRYHRLRRRLFAGAAVAVLALPGLSIWLYGAAGSFVVAAFGALLLAVAFLLTRAAIAPLEDAAAEAAIAASAAAASDSATIAPAVHDNDIIMFQSLVANIPGVCYRCANDADYTIEFVSDAVLEITGYPPGDFIGNRVRSLVSIYHPEDLGIVAAATDDGISNRRPFAAEYRIIHRDGSIRWISERGRPAFDASGKVTHLDGVMFDTTKRHEIEAELRRTLDESGRKSERLSSIVGQATGGVRAIKAQTAQLADGAAELATRTEEQVASLQQMAAAIRQMAVTQAHGAGQMDQAKQIVEEARAAAQSGNADAGSSLAAMQRIEDSARRIGEIIGLIEEIAFQTNLLALNAAVEAARAGDAGRGFAVVAAEVRALSHRASTASKEVRSLITNSSAQVASGVELVGKAAATLGMIVTSVRKAADMIGEIAASGREQSNSVNQVQDSVNLVEGLTQKNAEMVESASSAVTAVDGQIEALARVIAASDEQTESPAGIKRRPAA